MQPHSTVGMALHLLAPALLLLLTWSACTAETPRSDASSTEAHAIRKFAVQDSMAARPTVAVAHSGAAYLAWTRRSGDTTNVYLSRADPGANTLSEPVRVNDRPGDAAGHDQAPAQVAVAPDGAVYVAWVAQRTVPGRRFPASDIRLARSEDGGRTFGAPVTVHPEEGFPTGHHFHNLAVGPDGTVYVSWLDSGERDRAQQARGMKAEPASVGNRHGGHPHAAPEKELPGTELRVARSVDGGRRFSPPVVVARGTCQCCRTALAVSPDGAVYVAWRHIFGENIRDMAVAKSYDGGRSFSAPVRVHEDGWKIDGCPHSGPALAVDDAGCLHVAWYTGSQNQPGLYYARSVDGGATFERAVLVEAGIGASAPGAALEGSQLILTWEGAQRNIIHMLRARQNDSPGEASSQSLHGEDPALGAAGNVSALAWRQDRSLQLSVSEAVR